MQSKQDGSGHGEILTNPPPITSGLFFQRHCYGLESQQVLDGVGLRRHRAGENGRAVRGERDRFFESDPEAKGWQEGTGFDRKRSRRRQRQGIGHGVVHFAANVMEDAVRADAADGR